MYSNRAIHKIESHTKKDQFKAVICKHAKGNLLRRYNFFFSLAAQRNYICAEWESQRCFFSFFMRAMHKKFTHFFFISSSSFGCSFLFACVFREAQIKAKNSTVENFIFYSFCGDFFQHGFLIPQRHIESKCAKRMCFFFSAVFS